MSVSVFNFIKKWLLNRLTVETASYNDATGKVWLSASTRLHIL